jgi:hypothetical protein
MHAWHRIKPSQHTHYITSNMQLTSTEYLDKQGFAHHDGIVSTDVPIIEKHAFIGESDMYLSI